MQTSGCCSPERKYPKPVMEIDDVVAPLPQSSGELSHSTVLKLAGKSQRQGFSAALSHRLVEMQEKLLADYDRLFHAEYTPVVGDDRLLLAPTSSLHPLATKLPFPPLGATEMVDSFAQTNDVFLSEFAQRQMVDSFAQTKDDSMVAGSDSQITMRPVNSVESGSKKGAGKGKHSNRTSSAEDKNGGANSTDASNKKSWNKTGGALARGSTYEQQKAAAESQPQREATAVLSFQEIPLEERIAGWSLPRKKTLEVLESGQFETFLALLILLDLIVMASLVQINGMHTATDAGLLGYGGRSKSTTAAKAALEATDLFFVTFYGLELLAKVYVYRADFVKSGWNWMDLLIVIVSIVDMFLTNIPAIDGSLAKVARIFRMMRISRMSQICRGADSFSILVRSLRASVGALVWSLMLMCTLIMIFAMVLAQSCNDYISDPEQPYENRDMVYNRFGTFSRAVVSAFEVALGNWGPVTWNLANNISMVYVLVILGFKCTVGFAVLNVINAVFLRQTMKVAEKIDAFTIEQKRKAADAYTARLNDIFKEIDKSGDGKVTYDEFSEVVSTDSMKAWMGLLEIQVHELDDLFMMLDDGDGEIERDEFIRGVLRIKGDATAVDAMSLMAGINRMERKLDKFTGKDAV